MEQSSKTLTFVVPAYNMETYLERCVESLQIRFHVVEIGRAHV